jgi:hypothetical protein
MHVAKRAPMATLTRRLKTAQPGSALGASAASSIGKEAFIQAPAEIAAASPAWSSPWDEDQVHSLGRPPENRDPDPDGVRTSWPAWSPGARTLIADQGHEAGRVRPSRRGRVIVTSWAPKRP